MRINRWLMAAGMAAAMCLGTNEGQAQPQPDGNRPRFDPAQMTQRRMDSIKEQMEITDEGEWKAMQPLVQKVMDAQMQSLRGMGRGMMGGPPRRDNAQGGDPAQGQRRGGFGGFGPPNPDAEALQKAVDAKAAKAEIKAALDKYQESRKAKQAELEKAQDELRKVLTTRQEAIATLNGLL